MIFFLRSEVFKTYILFFAKGNKHIDKLITIVACGIFKLFFSAGITCFIPLYDNQKEIIRIPWGFVTRCIHSLTHNLQFECTLVRNI